MSPGAERLRLRFYKEDPSWESNSEIFRRMVQSRLKPAMRVLNLGAGPGGHYVHFHDCCKMVVGLDPDASIASNGKLSAKVQGVAEAIPFKDGTFDLVYMHWVVEHLPLPAAMATEVMRVLNDGGYLIFQTGNILHYSYLIASLTPYRFHKYLARILFDEEESHRYPTFYRMNTASSVRRTMKAAGFVEEELDMIESHPAYLGMSQLTYLMGVAYERLVNSTELFRSLRANILGCFRKLDRASN